MSPRKQLTPEQQARVDAILGPVRASFDRVEENMQRLRELTAEQQKQNLGGMAKQLLRHGFRDIAEGQDEMARHTDTLARRVVEDEKDLESKEREWTREDSESTSGGRR